MKSAAARFTTADRDAQDDVDETQLEMCLFIVKLQAQVATLQRDLLSTEAGVLARPRPALRRRAGPHRGRHQVRDD